MLNKSLSPRRQTRSVKIGNLFIGSQHPINVQSMTTTKTTDVEETVEQIVQLVENGCEIVRVTVQGMKEVQACEKIKERMLQLGISAPLVADIHFFPQAAMFVADFVDKVRINPGNFAERGMTSEEQGLQLIDEKFSPLIEKCKRLDKAMRIGVNHGSLSKRILYQYGNSIEGMVVSALEYISVCRRLDYHDIVISMKASNAKVMIAAYRATAQALDQRDWRYPLHLGVTEAGMHLDGIVKSCVGIGTLLAEGIGDTIRCSLTGEPVQEVPVCRSLLKFTDSYLSLPPQENPFALSSSESFKNKRQAAATPWPSFGVFLQLHPTHLTKYSQDELLEALGIDTTTGKKSPTTPDGVFMPNLPEFSSLATALKEHMSVFFNDLLEEDNLANSPFNICQATEPGIHTVRNYFLENQDAPSDRPVLLTFARQFQCSEEAAVALSTELGAVLIDGLGDAVLVDFPNISLPILREIIFAILLSANIRSVKTEYISCPSCGRTQFDIATVTEKIKKSTSHLPGLKLAIMGCIVNGPGEMADADFGLVGSKPGMVDLYVKHQKVKAYIPLDDAENELIQLLKEHNVWKDPVEAVLA